MPMGAKTAKGRAFFMGRAIAALVLGVSVACGGSPNPPAPSPGNPGSGETISGRERIGWSQPAQDSSELATFDYAIYVDGARRVLEGDTCGGGSAGAFDCSAPLPSMTAGQHTLELATFVMVNGAPIESARSSALRVTVSAVSPPAAGVAPQDSTIATGDGHRFRASIVARGLRDPADLAVTPDGRVLVAERAGRVRIAGPEGLSDIIALELDNVMTADASGLSAIALHPDFERNGYVYVAYAVEDDRRDGAAFRIARFRERNGVLAQGAIIVRERVPAAVPNAVIRFGVDGRLYMGFASLPLTRLGQSSTTSSVQDAQSAATVLGKILRLNDDGTLPRDNPRVSPTFSSGHRDPRAFAWHPTTGTMWELERDDDAGDELNTIVGGADYGWPLATGMRSYARSVPADLVLPPGTGVSGACFVPLQSGSPLAGELLVASRGAEDLLRIQADGSGGRAGLIEGMLQGRYGRLAAVAVSADGAIYVATANRETWGDGKDVLIRLTHINSAR